MVESAGRRYITGMRRPSAEQLVALLEKYREMRRMRREDAAGLARDPRDEMRRLAQRFPGALREIDQLPLDEIEERVRMLEAVVGGRAEPPEWARYFVDYHGIMRAALRIKRMCLGTANLEEALACVREGYEPAPDEPSLAELGAEAVAAITRPEGGRLNPSVFDRVAVLHGVSPDRVRRTLFPPHHGRTCTRD